MLVLMLVVSSVLANMMPNMANMVPSLMANMASMVPHLMASVVASVVTLRISWISSEHVARLDWGHMGTIGITLAIGSTLTMSKGKPLTIAMVDSLANVLVVDGSRVDGGGRLHHVLGQ